MPAAVYHLAYLFPVLHAIGLLARGPWTWLAVVVSFGLIPLLDARIGHDRRDRPVEAGHGRGFDRPLELWAPMQAGLLVWTLVELGARPAASGWEWLGLALSGAIVSGAGGITIAHELMHRTGSGRGALQRGLAEALMSMTLYAHFSVEHVLGHHRIVGTRADAASARRDEPVFAFLVRSVAMGLASAWRLEAARCQRRGIATLSPANRRLRYAAVQLVLVGAVLALFGPAGLAYFLAQALGAVLLLELINYIEHYGLERRQLPDRSTDGEPRRPRYERVEPRHSWNSTHRLSSSLLFNLTRHSDHHAEASRPYALLRARNEAPQLPAGYPAMMLLSLIPPLWFRVMNPRVDAALERSGDPG